MTWRFGFFAFLVLALIETTSSSSVASWNQGGNVVCSAANERYGLRMVPSRIARRCASASFPIGETIPMPVTNTRVGT